ncbi:MAG: (2Fe-2S)-binding protein [Theionarchaea archaeon]|nr:(2Fe-2S)-binding protein [Theionarchaea archaeon]
MTIQEHPLLTFERGKKVHFTFDGQKIEAYEGETIAAALHAAGVKVLKRSITHGGPRSFFCAIGKCASCMMSVDVVPNVKTCVTLVEGGMVVESQFGKGKLRIEDYPLKSTIRRKRNSVLRNPISILLVVTHTLE